MTDQPTPSNPGFYWACVFGHWQPVSVGALGIITAFGWDGECDAVTEWGDCIEQHLTVAPKCQICNDTKRLVADCTGGLEPAPASAPITGKRHGEKDSAEILWIAMPGQVVPCVGCSAEEAATG